MLEVQKVIKRASSESDPSFLEATRQIGQDWEHGRKGILKEAVHRKKVQKPMLVVDPEDRMFPGL